MRQAPSSSTPCHVHRAHGAVAAGDGVFPRRERAVASQRGGAGRFPIGHGLLAARGIRDDPMPPLAHRGGRRVGMAADLFEAFVAEAQCSIASDKAHADRQPVQDLPQPSFAVVLRRFHPLAITDVLHHGDMLGRLPASMAHRRDAQFRPDHLSVLAEIALLVAVLLLHARGDAVDRGLALGLVVLMGDFAHRECQQLLRRVAQDLAETRIRSHEAPGGGIHLGHSHGRLVEQGLERILPGSGAPAPGCRQEQQQQCRHRAARCGQPGHRTLGGRQGSCLQKRKSASTAGRRSAIRARSDADRTPWRAAPASW